jgi:hypothetical protein
VEPNGINCSIGLSFFDIPVCKTLLHDNSNSI